MPDKEMSEAELRAMLKPRRTMPRALTRNRQWVVTERDVAAFVRLLREKFPSIVFYVLEFTGEDEYRLKPLPDPVGIRKEVYAEVPPDGWDTEAFYAQPSHPRGIFPRESREFSFWVCCGPFTHTQKSGRVVETMSEGFLRGWYSRSDRAQARFLARVWRLSEKIVTDRVKEIDEDTGGTIWPKTRGSWCGFDALAWCQQSLDRLIGSRYRPRDDWTMPDLPHYERRRRPVKHDVAAHWAGIDKLRGRIPLFCWPIGYRRSDGAMVTANDIGLDIAQLIPVDELDRARLAALVRKRWEAGEWQVFFRVREWVTLEKAVAELDTEEADRPWSDFHRGVSDLQWAIERIQIVPEFRQYLKPNWS